MFRTRSNSRRSARGAVFVEFWAFFLMWLSMGSLCFQIVITLNRQVCLNYYTFLAARGYMGQANDNEGADWAGHTSQFLRNFAIENRIYGSYVTTFDNSTNVHGGGEALRAFDPYPQKFSALINMCLGWTGQAYPQTQNLESWAYMATPPEDEDEDNDNDREQYDQYAGTVAIANQLFGMINQIQAMF